MNWWFNDLFSLLKPMFSGCFFFLFSTYEWWDEPKQLANKHILTWLIPFPILFVSFRSFTCCCCYAWCFLLLFLKPFSNVICVHATSYWHKRFFLCVSLDYLWKSAQFTPIYIRILIFDPPGTYRKRVRNFDSFFIYIRNSYVGRWHDGIHLSIGRWFALVPGQFMFVLWLLFSVLK